MAEIRNLLHYELHLNCDGKSINEPVEIANTFNDHFLHTPNKLLQKLPPSSSKFNDYLYPPNPSSMFFFPTSTFEISLIISKTPTKFSAAWDGIPSIVLKYLPLNALSALSFIFNESL